MLHKSTIQSLLTVSAVFLLSLGIAAQSPPSGAGQQGQGSQAQPDRQQNPNSNQAAGQHSQSPTDSSGAKSSMSTTSNNMTTSQLAGVIRDVKRPDSTTVIEIKVKDQSGKTHQVSVSPSATILQADQKVKGDALLKGANVEVEFYTTTDGALTAKRVTILSTAANNR